MIIMLPEGDKKRRADAVIRQSHAVHLLREIAHQQHSDIQLLEREISRLTERSKASFALQKLVQPDIVCGL